ncbi:hypothetical protein ACQ7NX_06605 [Enterobacter cloacae subsp. dissolvens]
MNNKTTINGFTYMITQYDVFVQKGFKGFKGFKFFGNGTEPFLKSYLNPDIEKMTEKKVQEQSLEDEHIKIVWELIKLQ